MIINDTDNYLNFSNRELWYGGKKILPHEKDIFRDFPNYNRLYRIWTALLPNHPIYPDWEFEENQTDRYNRKYNNFFERFNNSRKLGYNPNYTLIQKQTDNNNLNYCKIVATYKTARPQLFFPTLSNGIMNESDSYPNSYENVQGKNKVIFLVFRFTANEENRWLKFRPIGLKFEPNKISSRTNYDNSYEQPETYDREINIDIVDKIITIAYTNNSVLIQVEGQTVFNEQKDIISSLMDIRTRTNWDFDLYELSVFTTAHLSEDQKETLINNQLDRINKTLKLN